MPNVGYEDRSKVGFSILGGWTSQLYQLSAVCERHGVKGVDPQDKSRLAHPVQVQISVGIVFPELSGVFKVEWVW